MERSLYSQAWLGIGTSFGLFLSDLEELGTTAVVNSVHFALRRGRPVLPLARWAAEEAEVSLQRTLEATLAFHQRCQELRRLAWETQSREDGERFARLYQDVARLQGEWEAPFWRPLPPRLQSSPQIDEDSPWPDAPSTRWVVERAADLVAAEGEAVTAVAERVVKRLYAAAVGAETWLPAEPEPARAVLLGLLDLALMPAVGRLHSADEHPWSPARLFPGWRLLEAVQVLQRQPLPTPLDPKHGWIEDLCSHKALRWKSPAWLSFKTLELSPPVTPGSHSLRRVQRRTAELRRREPHLSSPGLSPAAPALARKALVARRRWALVLACVEMWMSGSWPQPSAWLADLPPESFHRRLAATFERLFQRSPGSLGVRRLSRQRDSGDQARAAFQPSGSVR